MLPALWRINFANNPLQCLDGLAVNRSALGTVDLRETKVSWSALWSLRHMLVTELLLSPSNLGKALEPMIHSGDGAKSGRTLLRWGVAACLPGVLILNGSPIASEDRADAIRYFKHGHGENTQLGLCVT